MSWCRRHRSREISARLLRDNGSLENGVRSDRESACLSVSLANNKVGAFSETAELRETVSEQPASEAATAPPRMFADLGKLPGTWLILMVMLLAGVSESIGLALFVPIIEMMNGENPAANAPVAWLDSVTRPRNFWFLPYSADRRNATGSRCVCPDLCSDGFAEAGAVSVRKRSTARTLPDIAEIRLAPSFGSTPGRSGQQPSDRKSAVRSVTRIRGSGGRSGHSDRGLSDHGWVAVAGNARNRFRDRHCRRNGSLP